MAASISQAELKRDKFWTVAVFVLALIAFLVVFQPIRKVQSQKFTDVSFTFRYEQPFAAGEAVRDRLRSDLRKKLSEDYPESRVSFPTTNELRIRVPLETRNEANTALAKLQDVLKDVVPATQGKVLESSTDDSLFGAPPLWHLGPIGIYRPKLALRLGLDLQGGVQLVLRGRTQNMQYEFKLADTADQLTKDVTPAAAPVAPTAAGAKPAATPATPGSKAAPADATKAAPAKADDAEKAKPEAAGKPADAEKAKPETDKPTTEPGKPARDGGDPVRLAQTPGKDAAPADAKGTKDAKDDATKKDDPTKASTDDDARLLADDDLRRKVADRVNEWAEALKADLAHKQAWGDIDVELVGTNVLVVRTFIAGSTKAAEKKDRQAAQQQTFLTELLKVFPKAQKLGDVRELKIPSDAVQKVKEVIQRRVDKLGVAEAQVVTQGSDRVAVQLPGIKDPDEAVQLLGTTARLEFRKVPEQYVPKVDKSSGGRETTKFTLKTTGQEVPTDVVYYQAPEFDGDKNILVGTHLNTNQVQVTFAKDTEPAVSLALNGEGASRFDKFARDNYQKYLAIYLDREVISAPQMQARSFGGQVMIHGGFETIEEANKLKILLNAGSLPVPVDVVEQRTVSATLGADSVRQSGYAGLLGTLLIIVMMALMFRMSGWLANLALLMYCIYTLAALVTIGATLTMPGILGLLLSVGMAVDANVIVFERLKEEIQQFESRPIGASIKHAYERSWPAILDGNVTCLFQAIVLYTLGTGPIRGFAVTLALGIFCHLFTALFVTRRFQHLLAATKHGQDKTAYRH